MSEDRREVCAVCKRRLRPDYEQTVIGPVCPACWKAGRLESAPYWTDHARGVTPGQATAQRSGSR